jgi:DNA invertase Pin-like site-specific DNA recombinase
MFQMLSVFAEFERAMIQERVRAGLARARAEGKHLGRPKIAEKTERAIQPALKNSIQPALKKKNRVGRRMVAAALSGSRYGAAHQPRTLPLNRAITPVFRFRLLAP